MSEVVYEVLTEFVFDTREAINNSEMLRGAVSRISAAADGALLSLNKVGEWMSHGLGLNLSVMGALSATLMSFNSFQKTQISLSNIIASNMAHLTGNVDTFNDKMAVSKEIMKDVANISREYSLDEASMMATTKTLAAFLTPAGLSGKNMGNAVNMARMFEKSAPMLGIDTGQAQGELIRMISGQASMSDTLFRRLATEAPEAMGKYAPMGQNGMHHQGGGATMFNMLPMAQRFEIINKAMGKFSNNAEVNAANAELLSNKLKVLKNEFIGFNGVLLPLGEVLTNNIKPVLSKIIDFVQEYVRPAFEKLAVVLQKAFENPERIYATLRQLQASKANLAETIHLTHILHNLMFAKWLLGIPLVRGVLLGLTRALLSLAGAAMSALGLTNIFAGFFSLGAMAKGFLVLRFAMNGVIFLLNRFILPLALIYGFLQLISRAKGYAEAADAEALAANGKKLGTFAIDLAKNLYGIIAPLEEFFNNLAKGIAPLFQYATYLNFAADHVGLINTAIGGLSNYVLYATAGMTAFGAVFRQIFFHDLWEGAMTTFINIGVYIVAWGKDVVSRLGQAFNALKNGDLAGAGKVLTTAGPLDLSGRREADIMSPNELGNLFRETALGFVDDFRAAQKDPKNQDKYVASHVTNIGNVNIRQDFKENQEPDRIAHSFVNTLKSIAINPRQASGRSFSGALTR